MTDQSHEMSLDIDFSVQFIHRLRFTNNALDENNPCLAEVLAAKGPQRGAATGVKPKVMFCVDSGILDNMPQMHAKIRNYAAKYEDVFEIVGRAERVPCGEAAKNDQQLIYRLCQLIEKFNIDRHSYIVVIGGGAVLDAVGFAAAISHRGVRLVRLPTTTLAQADSGVGVKNGINAFFKKNFLGSFAVPWAVVNDEALLASLPDRDWVAGFSEVIKVSMIKDAALFERVHHQAERIRDRDMSVAMPAIIRSAELHMRHITEGGDPFEATTARPLDFGHWSAHKLEQMTYFDVRHGEAVSIGVALDTTYAMLKGMLSEQSWRDVLDCTTKLGLPIYHGAMRDADTLLLGIEEFREHLGGHLTIALVDKIGHQLDVHEIDRGAMLASIEKLQEVHSEVV